MSALLYIYRNLRTGGFSVRYRGKVIDHIDHAVAMGVRFKVNEGGRHRVVAERQKNVHAFVVAQGLSRATSRPSTGLSEIKYNPYRHDSFICNEQPIHRASMVLFERGKCFLVGR